METTDKQNINPEVIEILQTSRTDHPSDAAAVAPSEIDGAEVFDSIRHINDPEHPYTLEQLKVLDLSHVDIRGRTVRVRLTPTIPHCSMATLIGLCVTVKLLRTLPASYKIFVSLTPGSHVSEPAINKQLADKERIAAALENVHLLEVVNRCIANSDRFAPAQRSDRELQQVSTVLHLLDEIMPLASTQAA